MPLSSFVGREEEIAEVKQQLYRHRLLTLTGPGGCGKTRLALRVAGEVAAEYQDGVWWAELASLSEGELLPQVVASSLGLREHGGLTLIETLTGYLRSRQVLLLLDNCEHLVEDCARLCVALLEKCPGLRLLATSREPLGVPGEAAWLVPPLSLPEPQPWRSPASERASFSAYQMSEAIQLFVERAAAAAPDFELTPQNGSWVAEVCRRLDGIPLAIELAAVRVRAFSAREIAEHLNDRFRLLTGGPRAAPPRHQTLRATLDWSYSLLQDEERVLLRRLSVFSGGWTLEAARSVGAGDSGPQDVVGVLSNLVDRSWVVVERSPERTRYRFLETIRHYSLEKLGQAGKFDEARDRHLDYFLSWAEEASKNLVSAGQVIWVEQFTAEHDNLRSALEWCRTAEDRAGKGLRLAAACGNFWRLHGFLSEGRARLAAALDQPGAPRKSLARAQALLWSANLAYLQSDFPATRSLAEAGLALSRELGAEGRSCVALGLDLLGELATEVGDYPEAPGLFEEALAIYRQLGDMHGAADMLMQLGWAAMRAGDYNQASALFDECRVLFRQLGHPGMLAFALAGSGELAIRQGDLERAIEYLEESLALRRDLGSPWGIAASLGSLGWVALLQRDFNRMRQLMQESLFIRKEIGERGGVAWCLEKLAAAAGLEAQMLPPALRRRGQLKAVRIFGAAQAIRTPVHSVIDPADQPDYEKSLAALREALGEEAFTRAWSEGESQPVEEIIEAALIPLVTAGVVASLTEAQAAKVEYAGLSRREREVAALIAQGKANREIAEIMTVRVKTVETYVTRILNKLGLNSRVQIATWALEIGLGGPSGERG